MFLTLVQKLLSDLEIHTSSPEWSPNLTFYKEAPPPTLLLSSLGFEIKVGLIHANAAVCYESCQVTALTWSWEQRMECF